MGTPFELSSKQGVISNYGYVEKAEGNPVFSLSPDLQFQAGPVTAILRPDNQFVLIGTASSGVWSLDLTATTPLAPSSLSLSWDRTEMTCFSQGNRHPTQDVYAGGVFQGFPFLFENIFQQGDSGSPDFQDWQRIPLVLEDGELIQNIGALNALLVVKNMLILALDGGLFASTVPAAGQYLFNRFNTTETVFWSSLALGVDPGVDFVAATSGDGTGMQPIIFSGTISDSMEVSVVADTAGNLSLSSLQRIKPRRVLLASSHAAESSTSPGPRIYALLGGEGGTIADVLFKDIGEAWAFASGEVGADEQALFEASQTGLRENWNGAIAVSPLKSDRVVIG